MGSARASCGWPLIQVAEITPVFLMSLPRSGSTLAQRVLASHDLISTTSEPWLLLPVLSGLEEGMCKTLYDQRLLRQALIDLCEGLPDGLGSYEKAVRAFAKEIYSAAMQGSAAKYFVDKTPRYHLIAHRILEAFPEGKFIFLWRNPLAAFGSRIHSYGGVWRAHYYQVDLFDGLENLLRVYEKYSDRICAIRFEDMVSQPEQVFESVFKYLDLPFNSECLNSFSSVPLKGSLGDKAGVRDYSVVTDRPLEKWKETLASPVRKVWCRRYLHWIGEDRLKTMGYSMEEMLDQLDRIPSRWRSVPNDALRLLYSRWLMWRTSGYL